MNGLRRIVLFVLLLTVPFQAALGATGVICSTSSHHGHDAAVQAHPHASGAIAHHHHDADASNTHHASPAEPGSHGATDKCKICSECSFTAAPIPASIHIAVPSDTPLRVSSIVDQELVSRSGDGLFRPPRTSAV